MSEFTIGKVIGGLMIYVFWATVPVLILKLIQKITPKYEWVFRTPITKLIGSLIARKRQARQEAKMLEASGLRKLD